MNVSGSSAATIAFVLTVQSRLLNFPPTNLLSFHSTIRDSSSKARRDRTLLWSSERNYGLCAYKNNEGLDMHAESCTELSFQHF